MEKVNFYTPIYNNIYVPTFICHDFTPAEEKQYR